ncbi:MAG: hypothetical protein Q9168_007784, partial [Polycauliona sp. 1 TL-2023]
MDAFDELPMLKSDLFDKLRALAPGRLNIMITSRPEDEYSGERIDCSNCAKAWLKLYHHCRICNGGNFFLCQACVNGGTRCPHDLEQPMEEVPIDIEPTDEEIERYVKHELSKELKMGTGTKGDPRFRASTRGMTRLAIICRQMPELQSKIPQCILASCNGMFMLASLYMNAIRAKTSADEVSVALENLPQGYDDSYKATMERIEHATVTNANDTTSSLAKRTLMWVACSYRAFSLAELQEALGIDLDKPESRMSYPYDKQTLLDVTAGLIYIDSDDRHVRLCHATAQEYFDKSQDIWFPNSAALIARSCLQYLNRQEFSVPCEGLREDEEFEKRTVQHPFLRYACAFLGRHAGDASQNGTVHSELTRYLKDVRRVAAFTQAVWYLNSEGFANWDIRKGAGGLHIAAWYGLTEVIESLLGHGLDANAQDPAGGHTPLMFACRRGHASATTSLLQQGATVNTRNRTGSTAMFEAVMGNHSEVVAVLLSRPELEVNEEHINNAERTPLMFAVVKDFQSEIVAQLLQDQRTQVNKKDLNGCTALTIAAIAGSRIAVSHLLDHAAIDFNATDRTGNTALNHAAKKGHYFVVTQLLEAGAEPSIRDQDGGTALLRAIDNGNTAIVEIMLDHDSVDDSIRDNYGRTLLHGAATTGRADIGKLLISKGLDKDAQDSNGKTPLHEASRTGEAAEIVSVLLAAGADRTIKDKWARSPWDVAWTNREPKTMLLLENKPTDAASIQALLANYPNIDALPIWSLPKFGQPEILHTAIQRQRRRRASLFYLDPDTANTALHAAVLAEQPSALQTLLAAGLSPNAQNMQFRTPLHLAVIFNLQLCTAILLGASPPPNLDLVDEFQQTPLLIAQIKGFYEIALMVIEKGARLDPE